eukprot:478951-Rhodomonas_salina.2
MEPVDAGRGDGKEAGQAAADRGLDQATWVLPTWRTAGLCVQEGESVGGREAGRKVVGSVGRQGGREEKGQGNGRREGRRDRGEER